MALDSKIPAGPLGEKWTKHKGEIPLVSPANKRLIDVIVVGTGLAGSSAAASLAEMGYNVKAFCFQDSPRRAHSIAAQGGINAAKNYQNDGDSVYRLFYDTIKGGDYRSREANVHRLAEVSRNIIDQCVAQGVPFARDYGELKFLSHIFEPSVDAFLRLGARNCFVFIIELSIISVTGFSTESDLNICEFTRILRASSVPFKWTILLPLISSVNSHFPLPKKLKLPNAFPEALT